MSTRTKHTAFEKLTMHDNERKERDWVTISVGILWVVMFISILVIAYSKGIVIDQYNY